MRQALRFPCPYRYIENHFADIHEKANIIEHRLDDESLDMADLIAENEQNLAKCKAHGLPYILIDGAYSL